MFDNVRRLLPGRRGRSAYAVELTKLRAAEVVRAAAAAAGVSQAQLAALVGKTPGFVSQCLSGTRNMTIQTVADFLAALDLQIAEFRLVQLGTVDVPRARKRNRRKGG